ncbi:MAG: nicotinate-nucleotide adenylyltransferase [Alphaproteobacteria bacterium]|nr:nicotinate-nucleotide adenylyltransferase [Alphaproteobacteria bacterium]
MGSGLFRGCRVGLLGGSFNPAHDGHLDISLAALKRLRLHSVWWLVSPQNPLKDRHTMAPIQDRLAAARVAARDRRIWVTDLERGLGTNYTVDTLATLTARVPGTDFVWLMGADNLAQIPQWRRWPKIFKTVPIAVFARATHDLAALNGPAARRYGAHRIPPAQAPSLAGRPAPAWAFFPLRHHPASATFIRAAGRWTGGA